MAGAATTNFYSILSKQGEKYRRRRAKTDQKSVALAIDACIVAFGQTLAHQDATLGENAPKAWHMWLDNLPVKYDCSAAHQVHAQLLSLVVREHPVLTTGALLPKALSVLTEV